MDKKGRNSAKKRIISNTIKSAAVIIAAGTIITIGMNGWNISGLQSADSDEFQEIESINQSKRALDLEEEQSFLQNEQKPLAAEKDKAHKPLEPKQSSNPTGYIEGQELPSEPKIIDGVLLANKQFPMPKDFEPGESKEARAAFDEMKASAALSGIVLQAFSTYRSYEYQVSLYNRYAERDGAEAADRYSARPGYSEHQTGLAFDIGEENHESHWASASFGETEAAKWLMSNAYKFGFILRYPEGKEQITGYMYESWHYRYVGKDIAEQIFKRNLTLEEYLGVHQE